jgi:two-component system phosphate regulon response regulator OmpR
VRNEKILVVDDESAIRRLIWKSLQATGILIYQSDSVEKTVDIMTRVKFDLFLLDISLEHENDGYYLAQIIREEDPLVPIIFLSGKKNETDIITGLEMGGDYYITKPFLPNLLKAQVIATLDKGQALKEHRSLSKENKIKVGDFYFDRSRYQLYKKEEPIKLSSKETKLMQFFIENPDQVFSKEQIYQSVWNGSELDENTVMVFINHLRNKIEDNPKQARYIKTVWGLGYTFLPNGT